jgi:hypothetical protein
MGQSRLDHSNRGLKRSSITRRTADCLSVLYIVSIAPNVGIIVGQDPSSRVSTALPNNQPTRRALILMMLSGDSEEQRSALHKHGERGGCCGVQQDGRPLNP